MVYIRKIEEIRWRLPHFYDSDIISDLSTTDNDLSVWSYEEGNEDGRRKAILAMIMSRGEFKDLFFVEISDKDLKHCNFSINDKIGNTQFSKYKKLHRNIEIKTVLGLTYLAWVTKKKIDKGELFHMDIDEVKELFCAFAKPSEMIFEDLTWGGFKRLYKEKNKIE